MAMELENWKTQIKKGYLELCILMLIREKTQLYGFDLIERMKVLDLPLKEGTLYPMLNRMTKDGLLRAHWQTENNKGHPRKFYSLTAEGHSAVAAMETEFSRMLGALEKIKNKQGDQEDVHGPKIRTIPDQA